MTFMNREQRIKELEQLIRYHREKYYNGIPEISDEEFDKLEDELRNLDPDNPVLKEVGALPKRKKINTPTFLGSLEKVSKESFVDFLKKQLKQYKTNKIVVSEKLDGVSVFVIYENGKLKVAGTRGNGYIGEDITDKALKFCPLEVSYKDTLILRGEAILCGTELYGYKNRRNAVAGILNRDDCKLAEKLTIKFYDVLNPNLNYLEKFSFLEQLNLDVAKFFIVEINNSNNISQLQETLDKLLAEKHKLSYDIDGYVLDYGKKIAYKSSSEAVETTVVNIRWQITRHRKLVPVLEVDPVYVQGVEIRNVTAFNADYIINNKIGINTKIKIIRSNDVIPYIKEIVEPTGPTIIENCPYCNSKVIKKGVDLYCTNENCYEAKIQWLGYFLSCLGVEGISIPTLRKLKVASIEDLLKLDKISLTRIDGIGDATADKILHEVRKILLCSPRQLLIAVGIEGISEKLIDKILSVYKFEQLFELKETDILKLENIGEVKARQFINGIKEFKHTYEILTKNGLQLVEDKVNNILNNKSFAFTGTFSKPRKYIEGLVIKNGGRLSSINKKLDYLVIGDNPTQWKIEKAKEYNIKIISEKEFLSLLS